MLSGLSRCWLLQLAQWLGSIPRMLTPPFSCCRQNLKNMQGKHSTSSYTLQNRIFLVPPLPEPDDSASSSRQCFQVKSAPPLIRVVLHLCDKLSSWALPHHNFLKEATITRGSSHCIPKDWSANNDSKAPGWKTSSFYHTVPKPALVLLSFKRSPFSCKERLSAVSNSTDHALRPLTLTQELSETLS